MDDNVLVSVIIPVYNSAKYLADPFESLVAQTYGTFEVIIVNDGSTDASDLIIQEFITKHPEIQVTYLNNSQNRGQSYAYNLGIKNAKGYCIGFLDADDRYEPTFLQEMVEEIGDAFDLVYCGFDQVNPLTGQRIKFEENRIYLKESKEIINAYLGATTHFAHTAALYRTAFLMMENIWYDEDCRYGEDLEFMCRLLLRQPRCSCVQKSLYLYIRRSDSVTANSDCENIYQVVYGIERVVSEIPSSYGKLHFIFTRNANIVYHVICELYEKQVKKRVSLRRRMRWSFLFVSHMFLRPMSKLKGKSWRALFYFNQLSW